VIADAVDTAITLGWALAAWIVLAAAAACAAVYAVVVAVWWPCHAARDAVAGALAASQALRALSAHTPNPQRAPQWRTAPHAPAWAQLDEDAA
jgi:putative exporter of polyketide antibiotics